MISRMAIIRVRRTFSESEIEKYARPGQFLLYRSAAWRVNQTPIAISSTLALSIIANLWRTQIRTRRTKKHEAGEGDDPEVHGVDSIAAVELEESTLGTWASGRKIKQRTDQKTISQPTTQVEHNVGDDIDRFGGNE